ncbi:MAG: hypothetical protein LBR81_07900 [Prevotellaceae bacterium]|jgi:hypothetical protein|nr:hypothetical protein [Prevotellaceae bacterium]
MNAINKEAILSKTHYGLNIYSHILRLYYPDEVVLRLVERDCGLCRNPFNANKETLYIWIEKTDPTNAMSKEFARHSDSENAITVGDAFDFAELHYKQQGNELLQTLNKELYLHIGEQWSFYKNSSQNSNQGNHKNRHSERVQSQTCLSYAELQGGRPKVNPINQGSDNLFSFFKSPITNIKPHKAVSLLQIYNAIKGNYYRERTQKLRAISCVSQARKFKTSTFDYCTFSGVFTTRNDKALIKHSGLLCLDFDHLQSVEKLRFQLLQDEYFDTQLLFRSPSGNGLKWIISIDTATTQHGNYFTAVANYIKTTYNIDVDKSGKDISRACFLPYDPQAFINPIHLKKL